MSNTFTIHQNSRFHKLIKKLIDLGICESEKCDNNAHKLHCKEEDTLSQIFQIVFLLYATPNEPLIAIASDKSAITLKGQFINFSVIDGVSDKAKAVLEILLPKEEDAAYEEAFNSLLCIYIGMMTPLKVIYPNTYVVDLGEKSHEIDIYFETSDNNCFMIETTRGFTKDKDKIDDTYSWHFKKAVFRKWLLEKFYPEINCKLCYLTLQTSEILTEQPVENTLPSVLQEEISETKKINLTQKIIEQAQGDILFLSLNTLTQPLAFSNLRKLLEQELIEKLRVFILSKPAT
jgi:hypothetical protein